MLFNGDLSKYHPADAIMFLSQLNLNGVLSIGEQKELITLSFDNGYIVDAHSAKGDARILRSLIFNRVITADQTKRIQRIQMETGLPLRALLGQMALFPLETIAKILLMGMKEVLLELFLLDQGAFHFTDTAVEKDEAETRMDARTLAISVAALSDEYRDFIKTAASLERDVSLAARDEEIRSLPTDEQIVLRLCASCQTLQQVFDKAPLDSGTVMAIVREQMEKGILDLADAGSAEPSPLAASSDEALFGSFRRTLKKLLLSKDSLKRIEAMVNFCKGVYDGILILTAKEGQVVHCKQIRKKGRGLWQQSQAGRLGALDEEPLLHAVHRSGVGFFGNRFPSKLMDRLLKAPQSGECALIPVVKKGQVDVFIYAFNENKFTGVSPQHYLELLSWMVTTPKTDTVNLHTSSTMGGLSDEKENAAKPGRLTPAQLVSKIHDLPPLPTLVTRALELLSDPEADMKEIEGVIGNDQSLVSKLIKISNSALYGGLQPVESLSQALSRLGAKTTKSLVLSASMQTYFFRGNPGIQTRGQLLWQHAAECSMAARRIAMAIGYEDPERAFMGGVLHDIGKLILMLVSPDSYRQVEHIKKQAKLLDHEAEQKVLRTDHMEIGELLMEKWKMPNAAKACVKFHHHVDKAAKHRTLAMIVAYANHLSHLHGVQFQRFMTDPEDIRAEMAAGLGLSVDDDSLLVESVIADFQQTGLF
jgi:HD-like signal output (HDOD) protein